MQVSWKLLKDKQIKSTYIDFRDLSDNTIVFDHVKTPKTSYSTTKKFNLHQEYIARLAFLYPDDKYSDYVSKQFKMSGKFCLNYKQ